MPPYTLPTSLWVILLVTLCESIHIDMEAKLHFTSNSRFKKKQSQRARHTNFTHIVAESGALLKFASTIVAEFGGTEKNET